jgi:hypothetical protein
MINPNFLIPGNCYFLVGYIDETLSVPLIDTLIFLEKKIDENDTHYWLFQRAESYFNKDETEPEYLTVEEDSLEMILDIHKLQRELIEIEDSHPIVKSQIPDDHATTELTSANFNALKREIGSFLANLEMSYLSFSIQYRDEGFSIHRLDAALEVIFWIKWKNNYREELAVRNIFAEAQKKPVKDYLSQFGRRRSLSYQVSNDISELVELARKLLIHAYEIKSNETLKIYQRNRNDINKEI